MFSVKTKVCEIQSVFNSHITRNRMRNCIPSFKTVCFDYTEYELTPRSADPTRIICFIICSICSFWFSLSFSFSNCFIYIFHFFPNNSQHVPTFSKFQISNFQNFKFCVELKNDIIYQVSSRYPKFSDFIFCGCRGSLQPGCNNYTFS